MKSSLNVPFSALLLLVSAFFVLHFIVTPKLSAPPLRSLRLCGVIRTPNTMNTAETQRTQRWRRDKTFTSPASHQPNARYPKNSLPSTPPATPHQENFGSN